MYSFEDIERQAQETHTQAQSVLGVAQESVWKKNKNAFAVLAISATVLGASFIVPSMSSFQADLTAGSPVTETPVATPAPSTDGVVMEATDVAVTPTSNETASTSAPSTDTTVSATTAPTDAEATPALADATTVTTPSTSTPTVSEVNPFLSLVNTPETAITTTVPTNTETESLHGSAFTDLFTTQPDALEETTTEVSSEENSPFKENIHTVDMAAETQGDGEIADPLTGTADESFLTSAQPDNRFTGILEKKKSVPGFPFSYYLVLDDGSKLAINTQRDLRSVYGKEITIEIDGTRDNFSLTHVYYNAKAQKLAQSGPAEMLILTMFLALGGTWMTRRKIM